MNSTEDVIRIRIGKPKYLVTDMEKDLLWALDRIDELKRELNDKNKRE
jgi:hypothetical protein